MLGCGSLRYYCRDHRRELLAADVREALLFHTQPSHPPRARITVHYRRLLQYCITNKSSSLTSLPPFPPSHHLRRLQSRTAWESWALGKVEPAALTQQLARESFGLPPAGAALLKPRAPR